MNTTRRGFIAALCAPVLAAVGCKPKAQTSRIIGEIPLPLNISECERYCLRTGDHVPQRFLVCRDVGGKTHFSEETRVLEVAFREDGRMELKDVRYHTISMYGRRNIIR